jgi:hypothetical protein
LPLFKPRQLPMTSYGYQAPPGAVAARWYCLNSETCGAVGDDAPRRWPFACPKCGGPTDPVFAEPWQHEARGVEIQYLLAHNVQDGGFTEGEWPLWRFKDALLRRDQRAVAQARADVRALADERFRKESWNPSGYFMLVWHALEAGDLDGAADDLVHWFPFCSAEHVENNNDRRTNCRQVIGSAVRFLETPGAGNHPQAGSIRQQCLDLAAGAYEVLNNDLQTAVRRLSRA